MVVKVSRLHTNTSDMFVISPMVEKFSPYFTKSSIFAETYHRFTPEHFSRQKAQKEASRHRKTTTDISFLNVLWLFNIFSSSYIWTISQFSLYVFLILSQRESI